MEVYKGTWLEDGDTLLTKPFASLPAEVGYSSLAIKGRCAFVLVRRFFDPLRI